ncbi:hypothetical protein ABZV31_36800 [Streptomyces sp. NPDC005202]|uniref:hypothetical protein n=1 Tax=Streptomyces sp. NPDC005202 TaxID=3157021 RepID=UPI0033B0B1C9
MVLLVAVPAGAVVRPFRLPEAVMAVSAAGIAIATGPIPPAHARGEAEQLGPVVGFPTAVLVPAHCCDAAGGGIHSPCDAYAETPYDTYPMTDSPQKAKVPAWRRPTDGEHRWQVAAVIVLIIAAQLAEPRRFTIHPHWLLPAVEGTFLAVLVLSNPGRINRESVALRAASLTLAALASLANAWSLALLIAALLEGHEGGSAGALLLVAAGIWGTNVAVFALWYWEFDRGGPVARAHAHRAQPDFLFPQMQAQELVSGDWEPAFFDYLYVSCTNATAFSPTDTMPMSRWAKLLMLMQSAVSIVTVVLVVARAVNIMR